MNTMRAWGSVVSTAMARDLLFEDERAERIKMPFADLWAHRDQFNDDFVTLELDLGSVLGFAQLWEDAMADRVRETLNEVGRICKGEWRWHTHERTITTQVYASELVGSGQRKEGDNLLIDAPSDHRKFLTFNFASRDDAMLVRMTIIDLRSVKNADGGGLPQEP